MKDLLAAAPERGLERTSLDGAPGRSLGARLFFSEYMIFVLTALYFLAMAVLSILRVAPEGYLSSANFANLLSRALPLFILAIGETFVLITAGIDLSITSVVVLSSVVGASIMTGDGGLLAGSPLAVPIGIAAMLATGLALGSANGAAITLLRMPPFIVTLTTMMFFNGFAVWLTRSQSIMNLPDGFNMLGQGAKYRVGSFLVTVPWPLLVASSAAVAAHLVLGRTVAGRWLYAIGHNARAARLSGVPVRRTILFAYLASGACAATASVLYSARLETGSPTLVPTTILLDVIGAAVIGGTSLFGGKGKILGTLCGVLLITVIDNSLEMLNFQPFTIMIVKGSVILCAALLDTARNRLLAGR